MSAANKAKGSLFERQLEDYLNSVGGKARRLPRAGSKDIGDIALTIFGEKIVMVIEAKNRKSMDLAQFLSEADTEADNYSVKYDVATLPVVVTKTRQKGIGEARVIMTVDTLMDLLHWTELA
jgi:Holliday junction resolvase